MHLIGLDLERARQAQGVLWNFLSQESDIADELRRRAGPDALMRLIDVQSPMDIAALVWDKNTFYAALIESPAAVKELAGRVKELLVAFLDRWFARYGGAFMAHYPQYYMSRGLTLSEDEVGAVSPEMFDALFLPELADLSARYDGLGMHCCANARHQWEGFKRIPDLRLLNLVQPMEVCAERRLAAIEQIVPPAATDSMTAPILTI